MEQIITIYKTIASNRKKALAAVVLFYFISQKEKGMSMSMHMSKAFRYKELKFILNGELSIANALQFTLQSIKSKIL